MVNFKVGDKVRVINVDKISGHYGERGWKNGDKAAVSEVNNGGFYIENSSGDIMALFSWEEKHLELISDKPTKNQRISALESKVAELQAEVEALKKAKETTYSIGVDIAKAPAVTTIKEAVARHNAKITNEQRKAIIAEAKAFESTVNRSTNGGVVFEIYDCKVEYVVNAEKRTVVALLRGYYSGMVRAKGITKCAPDDVFNEHIGKAIALGRALGLDVSKFENAVKPTEVAVGQTIEVIVTGGKPSGMLRKVESVKCGAYGNLNGKYPQFANGWCSEFRIIEDTEAQY